MSDEVHVLFTMDVEPVARGGQASGPCSVEDGLHAVEAYRTVLHAWNYEASLFVHPEVVTSAPDVFRALDRDGATVALHLHTTKFEADRQPVELGGLSPATQRRVVGAAADQFAAAVGRRPTLFRPGCFSASDATYGILVELGFRGGGISIPGRIWTQRYCVWAGAYPYMHRAHEAFRQQPGDLPFVDIPLSVDFDAGLRRHPVGFEHYPDLRPGGVYSKDDEVPLDRRAMLRSILRRLMADDPPVKTLVIDVHNDRDFTGAESQAARHLRELLEGIEPECRSLGLTARGSTYDAVVEQALSLRRGAG